MGRRRQRILGVDPGTRAVGYGIIDRGRRFEYVECGVIKAKTSDDMGARLLTIARTLGEVIAEFEPSMLVLEKAFHGRNAASALKLGQARGAVIVLAAERGLPTFEYAPATIKQAVVGHGRATKAQIQARVKLLFRLKHTPSVDAADALAIALCHAYRAPLPSLRVVP